VLVAGIAAAAGLSLALRRGETPPRAPSGAQTQSAADPIPTAPAPATPSPSPAPAAEPTPEVRPPEPASASSARIEDLLAKNDLAGASRAVLAADPSEFR
jgi:hypothetical protein